MSGACQIHATAVALSFQGQDAPFGVLVEGPSGAGKTSLLFELMELAATGAYGLNQAQLVADDQTILAQEGGKIVAHAPATIEGFAELRGLGIIKLDFLESCPIRLRVILQEKAERVPQEESLSSRILGCELPTLPLAKDAARARIITLAAQVLLRGGSLLEPQETRLLFSPKT